MSEFLAWRPREAGVICIVFPEGARCVQTSEDLALLEKLGSVKFHTNPLRDNADLIARLRDADVVFLDYSVMDSEAFQR
jgi:hypothetical protein